MAGGKKLTGESPSEIINHRVLTEAQSLLLHSSLTISEIGFYLGLRKNRISPVSLKILRQSADRLCSATQSKKPVVGSYRLFVF